MSLESLFSESWSEEESSCNAESKRTDEQEEDEAEHSQEYLDLVLMFSALMSFEHVHYNNAVIEQEVQSERNTLQGWSLEELWRASEVDSTMPSSFSEEDSQISSESSPQNISDSSFTVSSSQDSEGSGELERTEESKPDSL
ncbi:hypothetical protein OJAV_G00168530 [Oryzias javanicus]|uniref:Uncharacterized protein n=1 Tax=Oryzias javanicus TaxID=123683 RepID=A0A3S2MKJ8_ORYJA|nr:hypothetical protein OJAV_G00168530 [Oryzias javanicus]